MNYNASVNGDDIAKTDVNNSIVDNNDELEHNDQVSMANNAIAARNQNSKDHCFQKLGKAVLQFLRKLLVVSLFAGMGGIDHALHQTGCFQTVFANEIDDYPARVMEANFPLKVDRRDIRNVLPEDIPYVDVIAFGFPCQPYSIAGKQEGFDDKKGRGDLFFEVMRLVHVKKPRILFAENVKNLVHHDGGKTFAAILNAMEAEGYKVAYKIMDAAEYGNVPQHRERVYIIGFREEADYNRFRFPDPIPLTTKLSDVIDFENPADPKYYYTPENHKSEICEKLAAAIDDPNAVYQLRRVYVRKIKSGLIPTLTANMGTGGNNVPIIKTKYGIRELTPRECFNAMGFPKHFVLPEGLSDSRLYKMAGNSVCVTVVKRIAENIAEVIS